MVKPKEKIDFVFEDYLYLDEDNTLRWKVRYGRMCKGDIAGRHYSDTRHEVCIRGVYYSVSDIVTILLNTTSIEPIKPMKQPGTAVSERPSWFAFSRIDADSLSRSRIAPQEGSTPVSIRDIVDGV